MNKIIVGITGASGSLLAKRLVETLIELEYEVHLVTTENGMKVFEYEIGIPLASFTERLLNDGGKIVLHSGQNMFSPIASGSFDVQAMVVIPCSMGTLAKIAHGTSDHLLARAADVMIKEDKKLILIPRETPLSSIHLRNMLVLSEIGVVIMPPMPAYYTHAQTLLEVTDITVGRILEKLNIHNPLHRIWQGKND